MRKKEINNLANAIADLSRNVLSENYMWILIFIQKLKLAQYQVQELFTALSKKSMPFIFEQENEEEERLLIVKERKSGEVQAVINWN